MPNTLMNASTRARSHDVMEGEETRVNEKKERGIRCGISGCDKE